jgi:hypothetical protein
MTPHEILAIHERLDEVMEHISIHDMTGDYDVAYGNNMHDALLALREALPERPSTGWMVRVNGEVVYVSNREHDAGIVAHDQLRYYSPDAKIEVLPCIDTGEWEERREPGAKPNTPAAEDDGVVWGHA